MKQTFTEAIGAVSPLKGAIDGGRRTTPRAARAAVPKPALAIRHACPECDYETADAAEAARHLTLLITGNSECGTARSRARTGRNGAGVALGVAVDAYVAAIGNAKTATVYGQTLRLLAEHFGAAMPISEIKRGHLTSWFRDHWGEAKPATWNRNASAVRSFFEHCREQGWSDTPETAALIHQRTRRGDPPLIRNAARMAALIADPGFGLRERALWGVLFDGAAKPGEVLALDMADVSLTGRCARVATGVISWTPATNALLVGLLDGRMGGPVFLTDRKARTAPPPCDVDAASGKARLSYRRAAELFEKATAAEHDGPWTLRQIRDAALSNAARGGADMPTLAALSRCATARAVERYAYA